MCYYIRKKKKKHSKFARLTPVLHEKFSRLPRTMENVGVCAHGKIYVKKRAE